MSLRGRLVWVGLATLLTIFLAYPSFVPREVRESSLLISDGAVNLGLDLQGGIYWLLRIDEEVAIKQEIKTAADDIQRIREDRGYTEGTVAVGESGEDVRLCGVSETQREDILKDLYVEETDTEGDCTILGLPDDRLQAVVARGVEQAMEVLKQRINEIGVREPVIAAQGEDRILVQLPSGGEELDRVAAAKLISGTTFLEFKKVVDSAPNEELLKGRYANGLPEGTEIAQSSEEGSSGEVFLLEAEAILNGTMLDDARSGQGRMADAVVNFTWNLEGTTIFRDFTTANVGQRMAAVIDGQVVTAPVINEPIGRYGQISGDFDVVSARRLAVQLRSGALPIPLVIEEERTVGPALGQDSIDSGIASIAIGGLAVVIFMVVYYRTAGVLATFALTLNLVMIIGLMGAVEATLTLPGIAGLVLTVGMAVDANVIIFERIREELRRGRSMRNAVQEGFKRSQLTILDANITTFMAAIILLWVGRGPVQGFGVTLAVGIASSVFCALVVTRLLVDLVLTRNEKLLRV